MFKARLLFVSGRGASSWAIEKWTRVPLLADCYSHAAVLLDDESIIDAHSDRIQMPSGKMVEAGVQHREAGYFKDSCAFADLFTLDVDGRHLHDANKWLWSVIGAKYDTGDIEAFGTNRPALAQDGRWICSALVEAYVKRLDIYGKPDRIPSARFSPNLESVCLEYAGALKSRYYTSPGYATASR